NDPVSSVVIKGKATSEAFGELQVFATWQRDTHDVTVRAKALGVPLSPVLLRRVAPYCPDNPVAALLLDGRADVEADLAYRPASAQPLRHDVRCRLKQVSLRHPQLPLPLDRLEASLRCT